MVEARKPMVPDRVRKMQEEREKALADRKRDRSNSQKRKNAGAAAEIQEEVKKAPAADTEDFRNYDPHGASKRIQAQIDEMDAKFNQLRTVMVAKFGVQALMVENAVKAAHKIK